MNWILSSKDSKLINRSISILNGLISSTDSVLLIQQTRLPGIIPVGNWKVIQRFDGQQNKIFKCLSFTTNFPECLATSAAIHFQWKAISWIAITWIAICKPIRVKVLNKQINKPKNSCPNQDISHCKNHCETFLGKFKRTNRAIDCLLNTV